MNYSKEIQDALYEALKLVYENIAKDMGTQVHQSTQLAILRALDKADGEL